MNPLLEQWEFQEVKNALKVLIRYLQGLKEQDEEQSKLWEDKQKWGKKQRLTIYLR